MATILDFRPSTSKQENGASATHALSGGEGLSAQLIFFPGVRYERAEPTPRKRNAKNRARAHDQINLPD